MKLELGTPLLQNSVHCPRATAPTTTGQQLKLRFVDTTFSILYSFVPQWSSSDLQEHSINLSLPYRMTALYILIPGRLFRDKMTASISIHNLEVSARSDGVLTLFSYMKTMLAFPVIANKLIRGYLMSSHTLVFVLKGVKINAQNKGNSHQIYLCVGDSILFLGTCECSGDYRQVYAALTRSK